MRPAPARDKLSLIYRAKAGEKVAKLCREAKISRKTFYQWLKKYNSTKPNLALYKLADHRFKKNFSHKSVHPKDKLLIVNKYLAKEDTAVEICKKFNISRKSLYAWLKNYQKNGEAGLYEMRPKGEDHYRYLPGETRELILATVSRHPEFSVHTLAKTLNLGHHGIQNLLERKGLSMHQSREIFAQGYITTPGTKVSPLYEPQIPVYRLRQIIAPFTTIPKLLRQNPGKGIIALLTSFVPLLIFFFWIKLLIFAPPGISQVGLFFSTISLSLGVIFFLYSLKYYLSAVMVLKMANSQPSGTHVPKVTNKLAEVINKFWQHIPFANANNNVRTINPLRLNFEKITLSKKPFVSIHVAAYNEKNVIERLIKACTNQVWSQSGKSEVADPERSRRANYELIIVDDSTDETTQIAKETLVAGGWSVVSKSSDPVSEQMEMFVFKRSNGPTVKLIHRTSRSGFKGGALQKALEVTDPAADYVVVFDADFVPYPDTIEQFVKAFQALGGFRDQGLGDSDKSKPYTLTPNTSNNIAAIQGYQWHVLNKSQTWVTRGVRTEYAGSYVIERSSEEIYGGLKQIAGSVYAIRADILRKFGWGKSITEDFELTLRLYEAGYKVSFIPYIQAPAEAVSTIKRLIRQRMRWAEGASFNIKVMLSRMLFGRWGEASQISNYSNYSNYSNQFPNPKFQIRSIRNSQEEPQNQQKVWIPSRLSLAEKLEFVYLAPYYLQAAFFVVGTLSWFISETIFHSPLPFWTSAFGWSLVFTNLLSLPLMNIIGLFLEESEERDYLGIFSFIALSYIVVPFQAYAAIKGFIEPQEGPWFRTPKTGVITDVLERSSFGKFFGNIFGAPAKANNVTIQQFNNSAFAFASALRPLQGSNFRIRPRQIRWVGNAVLGVIIGITALMSVFASLMPAATSYASQPALKTVANSQQETGNQKPADAKALAGRQETDPKNPVYKEEILKNAQTREITTPRAIQKTTKGGKNSEFIFHQEPRVRIKLSGDPASPEVFDPEAQTRRATRGEIEFETKTVFGQRVNPQKSKIYSDKEVVYEEIIEGVDLKYSITNDLLVEEFIVKNQSAIKQLNNLTIEQSVKTVDVKVVSADPSAFGFYSDDGQELFKFGAPFAKDASGEVSNDISITLEKDYIGHKLTKSLGESAKQWLADPTRVYPVSIDPSVIVSGGIAEEEVQFGGLQRKILYAAGANGGAAWYAVYNDASDVFWKRCLVSSDCDETSDWSAAQDLDTTDADNFNPSMAMASGSNLRPIVFWIDTSSNAIEGRLIDVNATTFPHTLGALCTSASQGTLSSSFMVSVASYDTSSAVVAYSDTSTDTEVDIFDIADLPSGAGTCSITDVQPGNITFGSGITAGDRPVVVKRNSNLVDMIFQDGDLSSSRFDVSLDEWTRNNLTIASVTDNVYSVTEDGTTLWVLTVSGTTATNFYSCCTGDFAQTVLDPDTGATDHDLASDIDMFCVTSTDCKIVYTDDIDVGGGGGPDLVFVDCDDETCSGPPTPTVLDSDIGGAGDVANPAIYCVATDNCKIVYGDNIGSAGPDQVFLDCTSANQECTTSSATVLNTDIGAAGTLPTASIDCTGGDTDCKVVYWEDDVDIVHFVDCSAANCSTTDADTTLDDNASGDVREYNSISCAVAATDCKVVFHDTVDGDLTFIDCSDGACATPAQVDVNANVGTADAVTNDIWCPAADAADCKIIYHDETANSLVFVDCGAADCSSKTETTIDSTAGFTSTRGGSASMQCISVTDCKFVYDNGGANLYFVDCDAAACDSGSVITLDFDIKPRAKGAIQCPSTNNCKFTYYAGNTNPQIPFVDCDVTNCFPFASATATDIDTDAGTSAQASISCPAADDCKIAYFDSTDGDITFADCNDAACSSPTLTDIDTDAGASGKASIDCPSATDCKIFYADDTDGDVTFADCNDASCSAPTINDIDTDVGTNATVSIDCPAADDCKLVYFDAVDGDITFVDCNDAACSAPTITDIDTDAGGGLSNGKASISCPAADDCKIAYFDSAEGDVTFADCNDAACSAPTINDIDTDVGNNGQASIDCPTATDCKVVYFDDTDNDVTFADCNDAACSAPTINDIDTDVGDDAMASISCPAADDCKVSFYDRTDGDVTFADCNDASCSAPTINDIDTDVGASGEDAAIGSLGSVAINCAAAADCKLAYADDTDGDVTFVDCNDPACSLDENPWTGQTNVSSVTLTLDTTNNDLYASIIKDTDEKAYWKSSPKSSISWGSENDWGWSGTGDHLGHISAPEKGAGTSQIGVVLRETNNFEFAVVPEKALFLLAGLPFLPKVLGRLKKRKL